jgi:hypothetical protein
MDDMLTAKIKNTLSEIDNILSKDYEDIALLHFMLRRSSNQLNLLLTHVAYLESKLDNAQAENQRLSVLAKY